VVMRTAYMGQPHSKEGYIPKISGIRSEETTRVFISFIMYSLQGDMEWIYIFGDILFDGALVQAGCSTRSHMACGNPNMN